MSHPTRLSLRAPHWSGRTGTFSTTLVLGAVAALVLLWPAWALGHGSLPLNRRVVALPAVEPSGAAEPAWVLVTNFGVVTSRAPTRYVCEEAFGGSESFLLEVLGIDEWVVFTPQAVLRTQDGCRYDTVMPLSRRPAASAALVASREVAFADNTEAGARVWISSDAGQSFEAREMGTPGDPATSLRITGLGFVGAGQLLVSGYHTSETRRGEARLLVLDTSAAGGLRELALAHDPGAPETTLTYPFLLAARDGHFLWHARFEGSNRLFWGTPESPGLYARAMRTWPSGAALGAGGTMAWLTGFEATPAGHTAGHVGGVARGELRDAGVVWEVVSDPHGGACVDVGAGQTLVCGRGAVEGYELARWPADVAANVPPEGLAGFVDMEGPREDCPADSPVSTVCRQLWPSLAATMGIDVPDGAVADAGPGDEGQVTDASSTDAEADETRPAAPAANGGGDGCHLTGEQSQAAPPWGLVQWAALALVPLLLRRLRRRGMNAAPRKRLTGSADRP